LTLLAVICGLAKIHKKAYPMSDEILKDGHEKIKGCAISPERWAVFHGKILPPAVFVPFI
jgi:hypothetical protein